MFTSLQTLRTHCLHFQDDVSNVPSHAEHVKRSLETSKIEKKAKKKAKSADLVVLSQSQREKNLKIPFSHRGVNIFQNPFNSIFVNLNANFPETPKVKRGLGEEKVRFLCFFFGSYRSRKRFIGPTNTKKTHKTGRSEKSAGSLGLIFCGC